VRRFAVLLMLSVFMVTGCGATLTMRATMPAQLNDALSCSVTPVLSEAPAGSLCTLHFVWSGPSSGEDSVSAVIGTPVVLTKQVKPGSYAVRAWASNLLGGGYSAGCDTTITKVIGGAPQRLGDLR
jgi:hypothetical protein